MSPTSPPTRQRIAVVGPGSVGAFFAAHLANAGHDVTCCARRPFDRYLIESDTHPVDRPATVVTSPGDIDGPYPWVLFCVKAHQSDGAAGWLDALCDDATNVLVLQNGIEHDRIAPLIGDATLIPTVVYCGAELISPGHVVHHQSAHLVAPTGLAEADLVELFDNCAAEIRPRDDFATQQWLKLSLNAMANGLTALTRRDMTVFASPLVRDVATSLLREVWAVARAEGATLEDDRAEQIVAGAASRSAPGGTSMYYDTLAGRPTEHDAIYGAVVRRADIHGIEVPMVRLIHAVLDERTPIAIV